VMEWRRFRKPSVYREFWMRFVRRDGMFVISETCEHFPFQREYPEEGAGPMVIPPSEMGEITLRFKTALWRTKI